MTTITSNGYYLIADKRQSHKRRINGNNLSQGVKTFTVRSYSDSAVKIHAVLGEDYTLGGQVIVAYAIAGCLNTADKFMEAAKGIPLEKFTKAYTTLIPLDSADESFSIVLISKDKHTHVIEISTSSKNGSLSNKYTVSSYAPGGVKFEGSGSSLIDQLFNRGALNYQEFAKKQHPLNLHLFNTSTDDGSSNSYDVYGVEEGKLIIGLEPTIEAVQEAVDLISAGIKLVAHKK